MKCPKCNFENPADTKFCGECAAPLHPSEEISAPLTETLETPTKELTTGSTFAERYQIIEELGKGGMGKVYKAHDTEIKEKIALKLINPEISADKRTIERFQNELKFARKISHRNVCRMYDLNKEEGSYYITMEYVSGEDLKSMIGMMGQLGSGKAISVARQVCEGLAEAHRLGVIHRDLKPQNIMIDKEGNARIMDFGIARSLKAKGITAAGVMIGTPEYMSPEQAEVKEVDQRADIYSLGVILYEMVTGRVPFEGETPLGIAMKHKSEMPKNPKELNAQIPDDLSRVILRCMEKDKEKRYQSPGEVRSELENIEKGIPTTERIVPERKPITSREITVTFGVKKLLIPALVVAAVIIAAVVIWQFLPQKEAVFAPKIENSIAVISFENQTGDKAFDYLQKAIPNLLITSLEQTGDLYVVTWERMRDILEQIGEKDAETISSDSGFKLCRKEGVKAIVLGSFIKAGDMFATDVKVLDVKTKKLLKSSSSKGDGVSSILKTQIDELSREISQGIGITGQREKAEQLHVADVTTGSIEAYNNYLKGREAFRKFYNEEAIQYLEKAVELDPTFFRAYGTLIWTYQFLGDIKARNEAFEKAKTFSHKATEKGKFYLEYANTLFVEPNREKRFSVLQQFVKKYPKEKAAHYNLAIYYESREPDKAIEEYNKALELDPNYGVVLNQLGYTYMSIRNYEKAVEYFKRYVSVSPGEANPLDSLAEAYFQMGRLDEAIAKYKEALEIKPDFLISSNSIHYIYALKEDYAESMKWIDKYIDIAQATGLKREGYLLRGFYHYWLGSLEKSLICLQRSEDLAESVGDEWGKAFVNYLKVWIYYDRGEYELSRKYNEGWLDVMIKEYPGRKLVYEALYSLVIGLIDLEEGRISSAKARLADVKPVLPELTQFQKEWITIFYNLLQAKVFLREGAPEKAINVLEKASPSPIPTISFSGQIIYFNVPFLKDVLSQAYQQQGDLDKAIAAYEHLITFDPESDERRLIHPKYHYRLAKLYEQKGWKGKAIEHYEKFLLFWKDADSGIAEVEDAKKRVAGLKGQ
jgi:serine/threonine protein kinase/Tfp pilus assembly protein PilF